MRLLRCIVVARRKFPNAPFALQKSDIKSAYQQYHLNTITAMQTITQLPNEDLGMIMLSLTFGGTQRPFKWNILSESICNLANKILFNKNWNPLTNNAPSQHLVPAMALLDASIPFAGGAELIIEIPVDPQGTGDVYIDDLIQATVIIDGKDNATQCKHAALLAINICACPKHPNKPMPCKNMEAWNNLQAEAGLEEQKTILGWLLDTRRLLVKLPKNKFVTWMNLINRIIWRGTTTAEEVESIIRQLVHLSRDGYPICPPQFPSTTSAAKTLNK